MNDYLHSQQNLSNAVWQFWLRLAVRRHYRQRQQRLPFQLSLWSARTVPSGMRLEFGGAISG